MAYIDLKNNLPGIRGLMKFRPETAKPLNHLAEILLRDDRNTLSRGERELIGAYVSYLNECQFCQNVHGALAAHYLQINAAQLNRIKKDIHSADLSDKLKALLSIAAAVQQSGKNISQLQIDVARNQGATDMEIHDTVLITAAFCMFNRYVDALGTWSPADLNFYFDRAPLRAEEGYVNYNPDA